MSQTLKQALKNCNIIDATSAQARVGTILISGDQVQDILPQASPDLSDDYRSLDMGGRYVLPGLWDVHTHIGRGIPDAEARDELAAARTIRAGRDCMTALSLGITGMRVVGERHFIDVAWKRAFDANVFLGPTLFTCGHFITTTAGHFLKSGTALEVDGPDGFRRAIREQIKNGVDFIKLNMTGGIMGPPWDGMPSTFLLPDEIESAFGLCHQRGFKVVAHAGGTEGIKAAVRAGAHTIEHGYILDDEAIQMMLQNGTYFVPTMSLSHLHRGPDFAESEFERNWTLENPTQEDYRLRAVTAAIAHGEGFRKALAAGVKIACGSDLRLPDGGLFELTMLVRAGMSEWQAIVAATQTAAEVCCAEKDYGTIEPGKKADLIAMKGNPLENIDSVRDLSLVVKHGQVVLSNLD